MATLKTGSLLLLATLLATLQGTLLGCAPTKEHAPAPISPDDQPESLLEVLDGLPPDASESFADYLMRARAVLTSSDNPSVARLATLLPDDPRVIPNATYRAALPSLLAAFAKARLRDVRATALTELVRHETTNASDAAHPGRSPAFDAFERDLSTRARALGLLFDDVDHIAYEITSNRNGPQEIGILAHADVVPASEPGWTVPPFEGRIEDGKIWGRGTIDDKGPIVAALYAMAALESSGVPLIKTFRLVVGTSEETHWAGIERYQELRPMPKHTIVVDAGFPVGVGEKGTVTIRVETKEVASLASSTTGVGAMAAVGARIVSLDGGQVSNQVPATARAVLSIADHNAFLALVEAGVRHQDTVSVVVNSAGTVVIEAKGKAAHAASPDRGVNAIQNLISFLVEDGHLETSNCGTMLTVLHGVLKGAFDADGLGLSETHPRFSKSTVNLGILRRADDGGCEAKLNIRWPPPLTAADVVARVRSSLHAQLALRGLPPDTFAIEGSGLDPFLIDDNNALVGALLDAYTTVTGKPGHTKTVAGTTYAKAVKGAVTFGPSPENDADSRLHGPNEFISLSEMDALVEMYAFALARLAL